MRKRLLSIFLILAFLICLFPGCGTPDDPPETPTTQPSADPTTVPSTEPSTEPTTEPSTEPTEPSTEPTTEPTEPPVELDFFTRHGQGTPAHDQIPGYAQETDTENLYYLPLELPGTDRIRQILTHGDTLYILYWLYFDQMPEGCGLIAYDIPTGQTLYDTAISEWGEYGPLEGGGFWALDLSDNTLHLFDATGEITVLSVGQIAEGHTYAIYDADLSPDGRYLTVLYQDGVPVTVYDLEDDTMLSPNFPILNRYFYSVEFQQDRFLLDNYQDQVYFLDPATGEYSQCHTEISCDGYHDGIGYSSRDGIVTFAGMDGDPQIYSLEVDPGEWLVDQQCGLAVLEFYGDSPGVTAVDLRNNLCLGEVIFPQDCYNASALFLDNGSLLIITTDSESNKLYLYDTATLSSEATPLVSYLHTLEEVAAETDRIVQAVYEATGIEILYGSQGNDFYFGDYLGAAALDPFENYMAVSQVAEILARYPDGMLREAWELTYEGMYIFLCHGIYGLHAGTLDMAGGVASAMNGHSAIALDITNPIETNLPHELSHVFDDRIQAMSVQTDWIGIWESIHPFDDAYVYSYDDYYSNWAYTIYGEEDPDNVWFVDGYSRTHSTEDRARIMELLWNSGEELDYRLEYEHILEKAKLYCYILRQCFPSCNTEEGPFWENHLGVIDESVLP